MTAFQVLIAIECIAVAFLIESAVKFAAKRITKRRLKAARLAKLTVYSRRYDR
jgi:hypothetical protein